MHKAYLLWLDVLSLFLKWRSKKTSHSRINRFDVIAVDYFLLIMLTCGSLIIFRYHSGRLPILIETNGKLCRVCTFNPVNEPVSTPRDAIITAFNSYGVGVERLIQSIRTTGSRASILLFTPDDVELPYYIFDCGVIQIKSGPFTNRAKGSIYKIRWEWYYKYFRQNWKNYDRVFHSDAFDAVYFGDPFELISSNDTLYFQMEDRSIRSCPYNKNWLLNCHFDFNRWKTLSYTIACSGSFGGGSMPFTQFVDKMVNHVEWPICWDKGFDQGDFNYILYTQYNESAKITKMGCNSGFITLQYCINLDRLWNERHQLLTPNGERPVIFAHQYNRYKEVNDYVKAVCPTIFS